MKNFIEQKYKLKRDPFPSNVASPTDPMVGRDDELRGLTKNVDRYLGEETNASMFVIGDYGSGKTLMLYKVQSHCAGKSNVRTAFLKLLPDDSVKRFGMAFIQRVFEKVEFANFNFKKDVVKTLAAVLPDETKVFVEASKGNQIALQILRGEGSVSKKDMDALGVRRKITTTESAIRFWSTFMFLAKSSGVDTLVLLVDEVEYLFSQMKGAAGVSQVFNTLRELHDLSNMPKAVALPYSNTIMLFAVSADGWRNVNQIEKRENSKGGPMNPFLRRLSASVTLKGLTVGETKKLIQDRLSDQRSEKSKAPLIPFTEEFVALIHTLASGVPHTIVRYCHIILRQGLEEGVALLTPDYAKRVLRDSGLYSGNE